ncbi:OLC1v1000816C1 [Oldenlandia corymbosa var. corymbosa]|uniref:OLC1v1000816C1 n=1 Tax=Oldenlandia corymbosa var. corymbosa TaxID=529605 RepID=A0AAV1D4L6_OLDCO|nr:OLC1v1000816C1 [Oldenlandia corymbosa var. corymbosa]
MSEENGGSTPALTAAVRREIAIYCKGLPLTIVILAGVLASTNPEDWERIRDELNLGETSVTEQCMNTLELSYKHLQDDLKPCLLYFGAFPKDEDISVRKLFHLWIAHCTCHLRAET